MSTAEDLYAPSGPSLGSYRVIESVERDLDDGELATLKRRIQSSLRYFPELNETTVTIAKKPEAHRWYAEADSDNDIVFLPTHELCSRTVICHELAHLVIYKLDDAGADVPVTSEEFCSIFAIARMAPEDIDADWISYLGEPSVPREEWPGICRRALEYREDHHNYIQQCQGWLEI